MRNIACDTPQFSTSEPQICSLGVLHMEDPIVIPTAKSVQLTLQRSAQRTEQATNLVANNTTNGVGSRREQAVKFLQVEVDQKIAGWQNELSKQSSLINTLEELLKSDLEALKAGKPPPEDNEQQRKVLSTLFPIVTVKNAST